MYSIPQGERETLWEIECGEEDHTKRFAETTQSQRPHTSSHEFHSIRYSLFIPSKVIYSVLFKVRDFHCRCCCCLLCVTHLLLLSFIRSLIFFLLFFRCNMKIYTIFSSLSFFFFSFPSLFIMYSYPFEPFEYPVFYAHRLRSILFFSFFFFFSLLFKSIWGSGFGRLYYFVIFFFFFVFLRFRFSCVARKFVCCSLAYFVTGVCLCSLVCISPILFFFWI